MIGSWSLAEVMPLLEGHLTGADAVFSRVVTDSRKAAAGDLFVALRGERFDGHDFIAQLAAGGIAGVLVEKPVATSLPQLVVSDTVKALGQLGWMNRRRFGGRIVAITGSNGKTTVKEMIAAILGGIGTVCRTEGNLNNHLGVPLSLLRLTADDRFGVFELGANHAGEIAQNVRLVEPDVAVLINAGDAHLEGFGSRQGIADAKGEIIGGLAEGGTAVLNRDSPFFAQWSRLAGLRRILSFGLQESADVRATDVQCHLDRCEFTLHLQGRGRTVRLPMAGVHNVMNSLAAAAVAAALGTDPETIVAGLAEARSLGGRLRQRRSACGALIIDDTYNASPLSRIGKINAIFQRSNFYLLPYCCLTLPRFDNRTPSNQT